MVALYDRDHAVGCQNEVILRRSESRRCSSSRVSVFVDQAVEDAGAVHVVGI
jgi:hypothetical protein